MPPQIFGSSGSTLAVAVLLRGGLGRHADKGWASAGEIREQVVEAAVFQVDHDHVLDVLLELGVERALAGLGGFRRGGGGIAGERQGARQTDGGGGLEDLAARRIGGLAGFRLLVVMRGMTRVVMRVLHGLLLDGRTGPLKR